MNIFKNYGTRLRTEFKGYNAGAFAKDALAGVTVAAVALPLALAFGVSSGATAAAGLVTAIIAGIVIGALCILSSLALVGIYLLKLKNMGLL